MYTENLMESDLSLPRGNQKQKTKEICAINLPDAVTLGGA